MDNTIFTFRELTDTWLDHKSRRVKQSTLSRYHFLLERHILPVLGNFLVADLTEEILNTFLLEKKMHGNLRTHKALSSKTICDIRTLLLELLHYAKQSGYCDEFSGEIFYPERNDKPIVVLSLEEQFLLLDYIEKHPGKMQFGILLALCTGLRIGEVCALTWDDICIHKQCLIVNKTLNRIQAIAPSETDAKTTLQITTPKTQNSHREVPIPEILLGILKKKKRK